MTYKLLQKFQDCVLLKRNDNGTLVLRDNEGDVIEIKDNGKKQLTGAGFTGTDINHLIEIGERYSLEAIRNEKKRIEEEWRENNIV